MKMSENAINTYLNIPASTNLFVDSIPKDKVYSSCDVHGDFEIKHIPLTGVSNKFIPVRTCPACTSEAAKKEKDEIAKRYEEAQLKLRYDRSMLYGVSLRNVNKTFDDFKAETKPQEIAKNKCAKFADAICLDQQPKSIIISGGVGTGKTLLASAIVNKCVLSSKKCLFANFIDILREIKDTWKQDSLNSESCIIKKYTTSDALIIDEIGIQVGSDTEKRFIFDIIDGRYRNNLPTILISNLNIKAIEEFVGSRVIDRLREDGGHRISMDWESHRINT